MQKKELMKQLTIAYENNDLHTLLRLEFSWIQKEENNPDKLTEHKLDIYNEVLKEQVFELEDEINQVLHHPRYASLHRLTMFPTEVKNINIKRKKEEMEILNKGMSRNIERLKGNEKEALSAVKELIRDFEIQNDFQADLLKFLR